LTTCHSVNAIVNHNGSYTNITLCRMNEVVSTNAHTVSVAQHGNHVHVGMHFSLFDEQSSIQIYC